MVLPFTIVCWPSPVKSSQVRAQRDFMTMFYCSQIRDSHKLERQVPVFISPTNSVAQLYPQTPDSIFVAPYNPQGYDGGIRTHLLAGKSEVYFYDTAYIKSVRTSQETSCVSITTTSRLTLFREIIAVYCENHK
jgi:hypothetical protein